MPTVSDTVIHDLEGLSRTHQFAYVLGMAKAVAHSVQRDRSASEALRDNATDFLRALEYVMAAR